MKLEGLPQITKEQDKAPEESVEVNAEQLPDKDREALGAITRQNVEELAERVDGLRHVLRERDQEGYNSLFDDREMSVLSGGATRLRESIMGGKINSEEIIDAANLIRTTLRNMGERSRGEMPRDDEQNLSRVGFRLNEMGDNSDLLKKRLLSMGDQYTEAASAVGALESQISECVDYVNRRRVVIERYNSDRY